MKAASKYGHFEMYLTTFAETNTAHTKLYCLGNSVFVQFRAPRAVYEKSQFVEKYVVASQENLSLQSQKILAIRASPSKSARPWSGGRTRWPAHENRRPSKSHSAVF